MAEVNPVPAALQTPWAQKAKIVAADALTLKTIALGGLTNVQTLPSKVFSVIVVNTDSIAHDIQLGILDATLGYFPVGTTTVPINSGALGTAPGINLLNSLKQLPLDNSGQPYLFLNPTDILQAKVVLAAVTGSNQVSLVTIGADF